jgi:hypothetical protein
MFELLPAISFIRLTISCENNVEIKRKLYLKPWPSETLAKIYINHSQLKFNYFIMALKFFATKKNEKLINFIKKQTSNY